MGEVGRCQEAKGCCQAWEKPRQRQVALEGTETQAVSVSRTKSLVGEWVLSHSTLGARLLSHPNLRVGLVLRTGVEQDQRGPFRVEGKAALITDIVLIPGATPGLCVWND